MWYVLLISGVPPWLISSLQFFYISVLHGFRFNGVVHWICPVFAGIKQGCPMSSTIFVICIDPLLRWIEAGTPLKIHIFAFADDIALHLTRFFVQLQFIYQIFCKFGSISGLHIKAKKSVLVPSILNIVDHIQAHVRTDAPLWKLFAVAQVAKYLGIYLGPRRLGTNWPQTDTKFNKRVDIIKDHHHAITGSVFLLNSKATPL
jgi:hypothetical protein